MKGGIKVLEAIKKYQVIGCVSDFDETNFKQDGVGYEWSEHHPGTIVFPYPGLIFLGMPKGFNHLGCMQGNKEYLKIIIFESYKHFKNTYGEYNKFNISCWKYKNKEGHTFVRGLSPRVNYPFLHIILENCLNKINCLEITEQDLESMD